MNKCVFLDRDGVINEERGTYTFKLEDFRIIEGTREGLRLLHEAGFLLIVVTNQAGITRGLFTEKDMHLCHNYMMEETGHLIDDIYYSTYHPDFSHSLMRKPDSLMFEKAMTKYRIDPLQSWMVGNSERDLIPAVKLGIQTVYIGDHPPDLDIRFAAPDLLEAANRIIEYQ